MASPLYVEGLKAARMGGFFGPFQNDIPVREMEFGDASLLPENDAAWRLDYYQVNSGPY